jgi:hypothetical protein
MAAPSATDRGASLDQAPAGQAQEDVFERAPTDKAALRPKAPGVQRSDGRFAIGSVDKHTVRQPLDALGATVEELVEPAVQ